MTVTNIKSYWSDGDLMFISKSYQPTDVPLFRVGRTDYPIQMKIHNRPATTGSTLEIRARPTTTSGTHFALDCIVEWRGNATTGGLRGVEGVAHVNSSYTLTGNASMIGTYGQVRVDGTVNGSGIMLAGLYGLIEDGGTYTSVSHVCSLWVDSHLAQTVSSGNKELIYATNNGATTLDSVMYVYGGNKITNLMTISTASGMVGANNAGDATFANWKAIKVNLDGTTHYLIAAQTIS